MIWGESKSTGEVNSLRRPGIDHANDSGRVRSISLIVANIHMLAFAGVGLRTPIYLVEARHDYKLRRSGPRACVNVALG